MSTKHRLLQLGKFYPPVVGGIEEVVRAYCRILSTRYGVTALVHSVDRQSRHEFDGDVEVIHAATYGYIKSQPLSPGMLLELIRRRYDLVHLHFPNVLGCLLLLVLQRRAALLVTHHAEIIGFGKLGAVSTWFYRLLLKRAAAVIVLSTKNLATSPSLRGVKIPLVTIPYVVDHTLFADTAEVRQRGQELRSRYAQDRVVVTVVGRLVPYKGIDVLLEALTKLSGIVCFIAGDGPERAKLEKYANEAGVGDRCIFFGKVTPDEKHAILRASDIFVLPSRTTAEAFGISQVEAQVCGIPVIASDIPTGVTEVTVAGKTGVCVPPGDAGALAKAIGDLAADPVLRLKFGRAGQEHAAHNFSLQAVSQRLLGLYADVLGAHK